MGVGCAVGVCGIASKSVADPDPAYHFDADPNPDPACHFDADPDLTFHFHAEPNLDPDLSFQIEAQIMKKCSNRLIFHTFWLFIGKLLIRIQLITLTRMPIRTASLASSQVVIMPVCGKADFWLFS
jgi:hypothetical protein